VILHGDQAFTDEEWARRERKREADRVYRHWKRRGSPLGWLHSLSCTEGRGGHAKRKRCNPIPIYDPRLVADDS
jgi:hypothetical protein